MLYNARTAIYVYTLDPAHFRKGVDLSTKAKDHRDGREVREMFIAAPLLLVQVGANNIRKMLNDGDHFILKAWSKALILHILEEVNARKYKKVREG